MALEFQKEPNENNNDTSIDLAEYGENNLSTKSKDEKEKLGRYSSTLTFINFLAQGSNQKARRKQSISPTGEKNISQELSPKRVGAYFVTDRKIEIPRIKIGLDVEKEPLDIEKDITYEVIEPGQEFEMTTYEAALLLIRDDFCGYCNYEGDPKGARLTFNTRSYKKSEDKKGLPTPWIYVKDASEILIDERDPVTRIWKIKPEFQNRYGHLIERKKTNPKKPDSLNRSELVALGIQKILGVDGNGKPIK
ncbi:TPA: hypothetical protein KQG29_001530 [Clostridioides difficile]|nr:hypothetical protein [Clostridioides difficile]